MKKILVPFFNVVMKCICLVYPYNLSVAIGKVLDVLYTSWIRNAFSEVGNDTVIRRSCTLVGGENISVGANCFVEKHSVITCWQSSISNKNSSIKIGDDCSINEYVHITSSNEVVIGNHVLIGRWVTITDNSHGETTKDYLIQNPSKREVKSKGSVVIGNNVWIADKVTVLPGVTIGDGCVIAANSVVTKDVPPYCVIAGIPAKIIKDYRSSEDL